MSGGFFGAQKAAGFFGGPGPNGGDDNQQPREFAEKKNAKYEASSQTDVPLPFVIEHVELRILSSKLYSELAIYLPFLVMFIFFAYGGRKVEEYGHPFGITEGHYTVRVLKDLVLGNEIDGFEVTKTYDNVANSGEWHEWFQSVLIPSLFSSCGSEGDPRPPTEARRAQGLNYLIGGVRVRTQRASNKSCYLDPGIFGADPLTGLLLKEVEETFPCYGPLRGGEQIEMRHDFKNLIGERLDNVTVELDPDILSCGGVCDRLYQWSSCQDLAGGQKIRGYIESNYHCGGYIVDLTFDRPCYDAEWLAEKMTPAWKDPEMTPFLDDVMTRFLAVEFFVYTPVHNGFTSVKLFTEISAGGAWLPQYQFRNFLIWTKSTSEDSTIFDFFFFAYVLFYCWQFIRELMAHRKGPAGHNSVLSFIVVPWNFLELGNLLCFICVFGLRLAWWDKSMKSKNTSFPFPSEYPSDLDTLLTYYSQQSYANSINITVSLLKILKFLRLNPRLGILTAVVDKVKIQLLGVLSLFAWSVLAYALAGFSLYGASIWEYHEIDTAYTTLLRMLVGDFEMFGAENDDGFMELRLYSAMRDENRWLTFSYFMSYIVIVFFFLLNMIIGILSLGFSEVNAAKAETPLGEEIARFIESLRRSCRMSRIKYALMLWKQGKTTTALLNSAKDHMIEHQKLVKGEDQDLDDNETLLKRHDLVQYIGTQEYKLLGEQYIEDMWLEIVMEWEDKQLTDEVADLEALKKHVSDGVDATVDPAIDMIKIMQNQLNKFEHEMKMLIQRMSSRNLRDDKERRRSSHWETAAKAGGSGSKPSWLGQLAKQAQAQSDIARSERGDGQSVISGGGTEGGFAASVISGGGGRAATGNPFLRAVRAQAAPQDPKPQLGGTTPMSPPSGSVSGSVSGSHSGSLAASAFSAGKQSGVSGVRFR